MTITNWDILIVEDEYDSAEMVGQLLTHHGVRVHVARNGHECLSMLGELTPTLVIMDLALPEMDGWETLNQIRANPDTTHLPVVAVTAYHSVNVAQDALQAGFDAYFSKPIDADSFVDSLSQVVAETT
jgi:CheY-like chemotaxis protein